MIETNKFPELENGSKLPLAELFYTIQGEGFNTGTAACFIRLGGCDMGCPWCDAKETWNQSAYPPVPVEQIAADVLKTPARTVVVTGGEPLRYPLGPLCEKLSEFGLKLFLETSGTEPLSGKFDWICLSPKKQRLPLAENLSAANELKVVVQAEPDFEWAERNRKATAPGCKLYLQPEWNSSEKILPRIIEYVKNHPEWRISLQTHKFMQIP